MTPTNKQINEVYELAGKATQGPWHSHNCFQGRRKDCWCKVVGTSDNPENEEMDKVIGQGAVFHIDADFIAASNPQFVQSLINRLRGAEDVLLGLKEACEEVVNDAHADCGTCLPYKKCLDYLKEYGEERE